MIIVVGSINMDLVARVPHLPAPGETVLGHALVRHHGGKGANQAVAAARLGATVSFVGAVGDDAFGGELLAGLQAEGVDVRGVGRVPGASGCALISVADGGENAIAVLPGANAQVALPAPGVFAGDHGWLLLQLEVPLPTVTAWARAAAAAGWRVMLNAAPMAPLPDALLATVDTLVVNQGELASLVGGAAGAEALAAVARRGPKRVVVTLGAAGCRAWEAGRVVDVPGRAVEVIDSTGAGDSFVGALAAALDAGLPLDTALQRAVVAGALSCTAPGARGGMPRSDRLAWAMTSSS
jgi:ribokinase